MVEFSQEAFNILPPEPPVPPEGNAVGLYYSFVGPAPQGIGMDMEDIGYFP